MRGWQHSKSPQGPCRAVVGAYGDTVELPERFGELPARCAFASRSRSHICVCWAVAGSSTAWTVRATCAARRTPGSMAPPAPISREGSTSTGALHLTLYFMNLDAHSHLLIYAQSTPQYSITFSAVGCGLPFQSAIEAHVFERLLPSTLTLLPGLLPKPP